MKKSLSRIKLSVLPGLSEVGSLSIAFVFFIIAAFAMLAVVGLSLLGTDSRMSVNFVQRLQAHYLAEAGIEYGINLVFQGQGGPYTETVSAAGGYFSLSIDQVGGALTLTSIGDKDRAEKGVEVKMNYRPPIEGFAVFSTDDITNVTVLDEAGDPDSTLAIANAPFLPDMDDSTLIAMATAQGHVETGATFTPSHGYPNFNYYFTGTTPNVTWVQNDLRVLGGRTVYGIFVVDGNIRLTGSARVDGVLYLRNDFDVVGQGGGGPPGSIVTGGIVANGAVNGTGNHITVRYNSEYMGKFGEYEQPVVAQIFSWREL